MMGAKKDHWRMLPTGRTSFPAKKGRKAIGLLSRVRRALDRLYFPLLVVLLVAAPDISLGPVPVGQLLALLTLPLWFRDVLSNRLACALAIVLVLLAASGVVLAAVNPAGRVFNPNVAFSTVGVLVTSGLPIGVFLWSFQRLGTTATSLAFGAGMLLNFIPSGLVLNDNTWKYSLSFPVCMMLLALAALTRRTWAALIAVALIAIASVAGGYRSLILFGVVSVLMWGFAGVFRQHPITLFRRDVRPMAFIASITLAATLGALVFTQLLLSGLLGARAQESSHAQLERAGDLLTGGRYEWIPTLALFTAHPWGYGPGAVPDSSDVKLVHDALTERGVEPSWQHVNSYMLGSASPYDQYLEPTRFKLHSTYGDLWINFGPIATLLFIIVALSIIVAFIRRACRFESFPLLPWFLLCWCVWDLAFSPIFTNLRLIIYGLALLATLATKSVGHAQPLRSIP